jgi:hypothetical protein
VRNELLMKHCNKRLNISGREKRSNQRLGSRRRSRAEVCRLADLASSLSLSLCVRVG